MLTTEVVLEEFRLGEQGATHWLGYYIKEGELVVSFMKETAGDRPWVVISPPSEFDAFEGLLQEFIEEIQAATNARALVTPDRIYR